MRTIKTKPHDRETRAIFKITDKALFQKFHLAFFYAPHPLVPALYLTMLFSYLSYFALFNVKLPGKR